MRRWQLEVTFQEARRHLGVGTQRRWSDPAIRRATPALPGLFSAVTLLADPARPVRRAACYAKQLPTFADALAAVRRDLWQHRLAQASAAEADVVKLPRLVLDRLTETLCYAA